MEFPLSFIGFLAGDFIDTSLRPEELQSDTGDEMLFQ